MGTIKNLQLKEGNLFDIQEENLNEDLQDVAGSEEDITQQQLKNLLLLTKQQYEDEGINIEQLLRETHNIDKNLVKKMLKMIKNTFWKKNPENTPNYQQYLRTPTNNTPNFHCNSEPQGTSPEEKPREKGLITPNNE